MARTNARPAADATPKGPKATRDAVPHLPRAAAERKPRTRPHSLTVEIPGSLDPTAVERALRAHVEDLARIARIRGVVQEAHTALPPGLLAAVAEQEHRWRDIERRYGLLSSGDVAILARSTARNRSEYASSLRARRQVLATLRRGRYVYPAFQFSDSGRVHPAVPAVIAVMGDQDWDAESIILWMTSPNGYLGGDTPADRVGDTDAVVDAATNAAHAGR